MSEKYNESDDIMHELPTIKESVEPEKWNYLESPIKENKIKWRDNNWDMTFAFDQVLKELAELKAEKKWSAVSIRVNAQLQKELAQANAQLARNADLHKLKCEAVLDLEQELKDAKAECERLKKMAKVKYITVDLAKTKDETAYIEHNPDGTINIHVPEQQPQEPMVCSECGAEWHQGLRDEQLCHYSEDGSRRICGHAIPKSEFKGEKS